MTKMTEAEKAARDPRFAGLRESEHTAHYSVPYTTSTPGSKGGWLKIFATSPEDALTRAAAWHALKPVTGAYVARKARKSTLTYGEPVRVSDEASPSIYTKGQAA